MPTPEEVYGVLSEIYDPEIPVNIVDLGLIYDVAVEGAECKIQMTLTSQACPEARTIPEVMKRKVNQIYKAVTDANKGAIEPPINVGGWIFDQNGTSVHMRYYLCTDVGGSLPKAAQQIATRSTLPSVIVDVVKEARRRSPE